MSTVTTILTLTNYIVKHASSKNAWHVAVASSLDVLWRIICYICQHKTLHTIRGGSMVEWLLTLSLAPHHSRFKFNGVSTDLPNVSGSICVPIRAWTFFQMGILGRSPQLTTGETPYDLSCGWAFKLRIKTNNYSTSGVRWLVFLVPRVHTNFRWNLQYMILYDLRSLQ